MNLLYLADPGSIHDVRWINSFAEREGFNCYLVSRRRHCNPGSEGKRSLAVNVFQVGSVEDPSTIRQLRNWLQVVKLRSFIKRYKIDILHIMYAEPNVLWANWQWFLQVRIVVTTRGTDVLKTIPSFFESNSYFKRLIAWQYRRAFANADAITCTSSRQVTRLRSFGVTTPVLIVRTGVDFEAIKHANGDIAQALGIQQPFVLMPRKMAPLYNHEFTLDAISLLAENIRRRFTFVFLRSDVDNQSYFKDIRDKAEAIDATICFIPEFSHADILSLYRQTSLVVMNPRSDGSPVSAMEALACKVPVILPPLGYDLDVFDGAFFFSDWKPASLKESIETILNLPAEELGAKLSDGYSRIRDQGNISVEMRKLLDIYTKAAG